MAGIKICPVCGAPVTFHERRSGSEWTCWLEAQSPRWISVKERLPEKGLRVLVCTGHGLVTEGSRSYKRDQVGCELWQISEPPMRHCNDVIWWMPLPKRPEEDE